DLLAKFDEKMKPILVKYDKHFEAVTGKKHLPSFSSRSDKNGAYLVAEYTSEDKETYFKLDFSMYWKDKAGALAGPDMKEFEAIYTAYMFVGTKKFKLTTKRWNSIKFDAKEFDNAEKVFPKAKIKKAMSVNAEKPLKR